MTSANVGTYGIRSGRPNRLGARYDGDGTNFALFSDHAQRVELCLFSPDGKKELQRLPLPDRQGAVWHGYVPGLKPGALYGYRVHGPFAPDRGHRFNPNKLLLDPYTRSLHGSFTTHPATFGYSTGSPDADLSLNPMDSAPHTPKSVVWAPEEYPTDARNLRRGWGDTIIYEAHVRGSTIRHPKVPEALRGTFDGMASDAMLEHLTRLGITTVELLPVQAIRSENALTGRGLVNHWGYNTAAFFAPEPRYLGPSGVAGFRAMVDRFHAAGIEVVLDVVYNHSAEGDHLGPTFAFRGLDNASYYRLVEGQPRFYVNDTGTGNTLNTDHPFVLRMILDSLRFWVECMGVDGFRFDLATALGRERHGFDRQGGFMDALRQDPVLAEVKLIAEPWDLGHGGYRLGQFPPEFAEWNDRFRDTVRRFWRGDGHAAQDLGSALLGTADLFDTRGRQAWASVNFAAAHDGFTLADVTAYSRRHNAANGEGNRDGHHSNYSDNLGEEGETRDETILAARRQRVRNMLATVLLSQGTPMILAGDEGGNSQGGNNNAYCQDNPISWLDWDTMDDDLIRFTAALIAFRKAHGVLRQTRFLHGVQRDDGTPDVEWRGFDGSALNWRDPGLSSLCLLLRGCAETPAGCADGEEILLAFNREGLEQTLELPAPEGGTWRREIDTSLARQIPQEITEATVSVAAFSVAGFVRHPEKRS
ncbi:glycogen debranching protein GlgX [Mameliella sediminis]|uniref:glycogen debranching protein GlgX n=1 Tax=Mameliella sediminis TaxID=2836866 RepID=UPI001C46F766|nr:glycogen debranching protein GlgX [Mameliella sediminis]MBV7395063.1 glycogen debranching protein GlgX [Mameliella sediminis]